MDSKPLKTINQWFNKENARLQRIKDWQGLTERQARLLSWCCEYRKKK